MMENIGENLETIQTGDQDSVFQFPNLDNLKDFVHQEVTIDKYVKQSVEEGYMTEDELLIARWVYKTLDMNTPEGADYNTEEAARDPLLSQVCAQASLLFNIDQIQAQKLYEKSLTIRSRNMNPDNL